MNHTTKAGLLIGVLCGIWVFVMGFSGWYKDPVMLYAFWLVILIQLGVLIWGLKAVATTGASYGKLVGSGTMMSVIGGLILFFTSLLFTTVVFPHYFEELRTIQEQMLKESGKSEQEIMQEMQAAATMSTSFINAISGFIGTVVTGLTASLIIGAIVRKKSA
ncbi:MAG: DUF4199 domain-containing protein [Bacteroidota bacterium]